MWIVLSEEFDLGVFQVSDLRSSENHFGELIRTAGYQFPMIISGHVNGENSLFSRLPKRSNTIMLREPVVVEDLVGVSRKLLSRGAICQAMHPRFSTDEVAFVEKYGVNSGRRRLVSRVCNMSMGGVRLEFEELVQQKFQLGDFLKLKFEFKKLKSDRSVTAQVVWTSRDKASGRDCLGLAFVR